ncbi:protein kinase [Anabaena aphanizomenioides LEGE 00250]|uniref:Protein kinase n=1 Tax=Sphaerospermopsis aphanizomenoides LEGE 00250 TaxID=2777972 RepID=A0ABR9VG79_9CYAN|nr:serine/threonine-protein kinase [Sphaerospermopsis aphanizomenoides]MBE9236702.1 protein kinase [Sphaerospermopsis aphanizomenoides LEGE 00250]
MQCPTCLTDNVDHATICIACGTPLTPHSPTSNLHLSPGTLIGNGRYRIENVLGQGGFGITYAATYLQNSAKVAIKELWPENAARQGNTVLWPMSITPVQRQEQLQRFQIEANYLQQCVHPNIAKIYEYFLENNTAYMIMELLVGKSLDQILATEGILAENRVKNYFLQIAEALKVIHSHNLLHRDIKPENIIIVDPDQAVLIDFGAAREFIAGQTGDMTRILTPGYAPYEQYIQKGKRFPGTDIYALCASMYELLTGKLPTEATERASAFLQNSALNTLVTLVDPLIAPRQLRPDLSLLMEKVILTGMQFRIEDRFQTANELIAALQGKFISPQHQRAKELVKQGKLNDAVQAYQKYLSVEPENGEAAVELALLQIYIDEQEAEIDAQNAIKLQANDGRGYGVLGLINCRQNNWQEAVKNLQIAVNLSPNEAWIQANYAWALAKSGNLAAAEKTIDTVLKIQPDCTFALSLQSWIYVQQQQWKLAIRKATQAIFKLNNQVNNQVQNQLNHHEKQLQTNLQNSLYPYLIIALEKAVVTKQANDVDRRIAEFIHQVPNSSIAWGLKGWKQGNQYLWQDALISFEKAAHQTSHQTSIPGWVFLNYAITQENLKNYQDAIQIYENYLQTFPPLAFPYFRLGTLYAQIGVWNQAKLYLEKAIKCNGNYAEAYHNLGWVLMNSKNQDGEIENSREMLSAYSQAIKLYTLSATSQSLQIAANIKQAFQLIGVNI